MALAHKIELYRDKRLRSKPLPAGSAPFTSSNFFKLQDYASKPKAAKWNHRLSLDSLNQIISPLKSASRGKEVNMVSLGTARPSAEYYPWLQMDMKSLLSASPNEDAKKNTSSQSCNIGEQEYNLSVAMNYGYSAGSPQLLRFVTEHVELIHQPKYEDWESCLTCGTTSALEIAFRILCNPDDHVLFEGYSYSGTITTIKSQGLQTCGIRMDKGGICPKDLDEKLENWDASKGRKPFVLYTIPTGQNPTGTTQTENRRREVYRVAEKHDLYIIEDDPYYFLQMNSVEEGPNFNPDNYLKKLPSSYLSLDTSGRVLRLDTASKILAPGLRCGWVTGCSQIVEKFISYSEVGVLSPSGPSQVMMYKLLDQDWGHDGFVSWLASLSQQYRVRRDILTRALESTLPQGLCHWETPEAGMFIWIGVDMSTYPGLNEADYSSQDKKHICLEVEDRIYCNCKEKGVLISKGSWFVTLSQPSDKVYLRLTFAAAPQKELLQAVQTFAGVIQEIIPNTAYVV